LRITDLRKQEFRRILLIKPSAVGDVIHTLPVLTKLRQRYPSARIDWMLTPPNAELIRGHPAVSNIVLFERQAYGRFWKDWSSPLDLARMLIGLRQTNYDLVIDLHGQFRSACFALATGAPTRIGFDRPRRRVRRAGRALPEGTFDHAWHGARELSWVAYTHHIPIPTLDAHATDRYLWIGEMLDLPTGPAKFDLPVSVVAQNRIQRLLAKHGAGEKPLAVLTPGSVWETKRWLASGFAAVARHFIDAGWSVVLAGSPMDCDACREVENRCGDSVNLCGLTSLSDLVALMRRARLCIANDSGPLHLAAALGTPLVAIFGSTDPVWVGPYEQPDAVVRAGVVCSPCYLRQLRQCRFNHTCMREVTAEIVIERAEHILSSRGASDGAGLQTIRG
jgi:lipopolysaccharide heptosyltransferase II